MARPKKLFLNDAVMRAKWDAFHIQRRKSYCRGIEWDFDFEEWVEKWGDKWDNRGKSSDSFCLSRIGDVGPYNWTNTRIITIKENIQEGRSIPIVVGGKLYPSIVAAAEHYGLPVTTFRRRLKSGKIR